MDINQIMPLLSNLLNKNQPSQQTETKTTPFLNTYPDTTFEGEKINIQNLNQQQPKTNNLISSLIPNLLSNRNFDISTLTSLLGKSETNPISSLFSPQNNKKTNPQKICEFVKVDDYEL